MNVNIQSPNASRRQPNQSHVPEDDVDPREIDKVITEVAGMAGRWNLFRRFLFDRLKVHIFLRLVACCSS